MQDNKFPLGLRLLFLIGLGLYGNLSEWSQVTRHWSRLSFRLWKCQSLSLIMVAFNKTTHLSPVVRRPISANPRINFNPGFYISQFKSRFAIIFPIHSIIKLQTSGIKLNFLWKLLDLKSNFTLTLAYLNPFNNLALNDYTAYVLLLFCWNHLVNSTYC